MVKTLIPEQGSYLFGTRKQLSILFFLTTVCVVAFFLAILNGSYQISLTEIFSAEQESIQKVIINDIRLPRVLLSLLVGASLGMCGAVLQGLFRNPLADPGLIGVSAGAALGAAIAIVVTPKFISESSFGLFLLPIAGVLGASLVIGLLFTLTKGFGYQGTTYLLLVGIAINAIVGVAIGVLTYISTDSELRTLTFWTMGSFGGITWLLLIPASFVIITSLLLLIPSSRNLDLIQLGEAEASRLGVDVKKLKIRVFLCCASCVGAGVALSGMIGFVGLVVPHLARLLGGVSHRYLLPGAALLGASLMVSADLLARIIIQPAELPIGLITSAIGSPFFLWLIFRMKKNDY